MNGTHLRSRAGPHSRGIFRALSEEEWGATGLPALVTFERKTLLFAEHAPATHVYMLVSGLVKLHRTSGSQTQVVDISEGGNVVGVEALSGGPYHAGATALQRATAYRITAAHFARMLENDARIAVALAHNLGNECARLQTLLTDLGTKSALARVASLLLTLMERQDPQVRDLTFTLPISRQDIGAMLGLSPETVSRQLKALLLRRVIRLDHKRLTVTDLSVLRHLARPS